MSIFLLVFGWLGKIPYVRTGALILLLCSLSYAAGNWHSTKKALEQQAVEAEDRAARTQAEVTSAILTYQKAQAARQTAQLDLERQADEKAHTGFSVALTQAQRGRANAEAEISKWKDKASVTLAEGVMSSPVAAPSCVLDGHIRRVLDQASGAADAGDPGPGGTAEARTPARTDEAPGESPLTCDQLANGYAALGEWGLDVKAQLEALQEWNKIISGER